MIISSALLILASYNGPTASPDKHLTPTRKQQQRIERNDSTYLNPQADHHDAVQSKQRSEPEEAQAGRMVVPEKFR